MRRGSWRRSTRSPTTGPPCSPIALPVPGPAVVSLREAYFAPAELVPAEVAAGRVSADALAAYPPGIPNVLPGEVITATLGTSSGVRPPRRSATSAVPSTQD